MFKIFSPRQVNHCILQWKDNSVFSKIKGQLKEKKKRDKKQKQKKKGKKKILREG